jgi:hypothetical protein
MNAVEGFNDDIKYEFPYKDNKALVKRDGRWGLFKVYLERGETPSALVDQRFTSLDFAKLAIEQHLASSAKSKEKI